MQDLSFTSTAYLGLDRHDELLALVHEGLSLYGVHYGGSRRAPQAPGVYEEAEQELARWTGAPAALLVSSGTLAAQLTVRLLAQRCQLRTLGAVHPALDWPGNQVIDAASAAELLPQPGPPLALLAERVDPIRVQVPTWQWLDELKAGREAILLLDDSHVIGVWGPEGGGSWAALRQRWPGELIVTASLGKAFSIPAGIILGEAERIAALRAAAFFGGASPPSPAYIHAWLRGLPLALRQRRQLLDNIDWWQAHLPAGLRSLPQYPVTYSADATLAARLAQVGITISHFPYPGPTDAPVSRIVLSARHRQPELEYLRDSILQVGNGVDEREPFSNAGG